MAEVSFCRSFLFRLRVDLGSSVPGGPVVVEFPAFLKLRVAVLSLLAGCALGTKWKLSTEMKSMPSTDFPIGKHEFGEA